MKLMHNRKLNSDGFTLVELLLVIAVIAVLSTLAVGVIGSSQNDAKVAATRSRIQVIEKLLAAELEDFEVRRSPLPFPVISTITGLVTSKPTPKWSAGPTAAPTQNFLTHTRNLKRILTLDLMRSEYPDISAGGPIVLGQFPSPQLQNFFTDELNLTDAEVAQIVVTARQYNTANVTRWSGTTITSTGDALVADSSEILYQILSQLDVGGTNGLDSIGGNRATGDSDGDGVPEVVDAWGGPIAFQFHQNLIIPTEQDVPLTVALGPPVNNESGVWVDWDGPERFTNFSVTLPVLPSEVRFFMTSARLQEIDGEPTDFITPADFVATYTP